MNARTHTIEARTRGPLASQAVMAALLALSIPGCDLADRILQVEVADQIEADAFLNPANAELLVRSVISDFELAFMAYIRNIGGTGDELMDANLQVTNKGYDRRTVDATGPHDFALASGTGGLYIPLSTARWMADNALELLQGWTDEEVPGNRTEHIAVAAAHSGYSHLLIGEAMCSAAFDLGPELGKEEIWGRALDRFEMATALAATVGNSSILNMARVGTARTLLNLDRVEQAASVAAEVPQGFVRYATTSGAAGRRENLIYTSNVRGTAWSVGIPYRNVTWEGVPDPRVPVEDGGVLGADSFTPMWRQAKYDEVSSPIPIARWAEARLIIAEAEFRAGRHQATVEVINELHGLAGLPPFHSNDPDEIWEHLIRERRYELFLESHHFYDMVRYGVEWNPAPGTQYPPKAGGTYADIACFPLHEIETANNPSIGNPR